MKLGSVKSFLFIMLILASAVSCVYYPVKESTSVQKVDSKIIEEFNRSMEGEDFFEACRSYIEFTACCNDDRKYEMIRRVEELYKKKVSQVTEPLSALEYTYSFLNLAEGSLDEETLTKYREELNSSIERWIKTELQNKSDLEKISWLTYLSDYVKDDPLVLKSLVELAIRRENLLFAEKYFRLYRDHVATGTSEKEFKELTERMEEFRSQYSDGKQQIEIEDTIRSSVRIVVDKGIRTESGVGVPDQMLGTGVVIDERGYILTNYHIIETSVDPKYEGYSKVYVIPGKDEGERLVSKIIGYDSVFDLALLKIEKNMESLIKFGDSDVLKQGEQVVAIGNPVGLTNTVTSGVISSTERPFLQIGTMIQIDAALNPGNSGGALISSDGYLVGIAFAGLENYENLNFAIPSNLILSVLHRLFEEGQVKRSWIGCGVEIRDENVIINYIVPEGPADYSRLLNGDVLREVNGVPVKDVYDVQRAIANRINPLVIPLTIEKNNKTQRRNVLLGERPRLPAEYVWSRDAHENIITPLFGIVITKIDSSRKRDYLVTRIVSGSVASAAGISEGDTIKIKGVKYDENYKVFSLIMELKSKRFGYLNKSMILYNFSEVNSFI